MHLQKYMYTQKSRSAGEDSTRREGRYLSTCLNRSFASAFDNISPAPSIPWYRHTLGQYHYLSWTVPPYARSVPPYALFVPRSHGSTRLQYRAAYADPPKPNANRHNPGGRQNFTCRSSARSIFFDLKRPMHTFRVSAFGFRSFGLRLEGWGMRSWGVGSRVRLGFLGSRVSRVSGLGSRVGTDLSLSIAVKALFRLPNLPTSTSATSAATTLVPNNPGTSVLA
eukprot:1282164-Rhodomonas_salina.1